MTRSGRRWIDALWGALASMATIIPLVWYVVTAPEEPFNSVEVLQFEQEGSWVFVTVGFNKNDACEFVDLRVFGHDFGAWHPLEWKDREKPQGDRLAGGQTLRISVKTDDHVFDKIEIRTRHMCNGVKTDRIFLSEEL